MSEDTTTKSQNTGSTSQRQLWQELELLFGNLRLAFWLMLMTPWIVFLVVIWPSVIILHRGRGLVSTQVASVASTAKSVVEKSNTQVLYLSSKSLNQLSDAVLKTGSEAGVPLSTFLSGIRKSKTSWFSKTTKEQKTTE